MNRARVAVRLVRRPPVGQSPTGVGRAVVMHDGRVRLDVRAARVSWLSRQRIVAESLALDWRISLVERRIARHERQNREIEAEIEHMKRLDRERKESARARAAEDAALNESAERLLAYQMFYGPLELSTRSRYVLRSYEDVSPHLFQDSEPAGLAETLRAWSEAREKSETTRLLILPAERLLGAA